MISQNNLRICYFDYHHLMMNPSLAPPLRYGAANAGYTDDDSTELSKEGPATVSWAVPVEAAAQPLTLARDPLDPGSVAGSRDLDSTVRAQCV